MKRCVTDVESSLTYETDGPCGEWFLCHRQKFPDHPTQNQFVSSQLFQKYKLLGENAAYELLDLSGNPNDPHRHNCLQRVEAEIKPTPNGYCCQRKRRRKLASKSADSDPPVAIKYDQYANKSHPQAFAPSLQRAMRMTWIPLSRILMVLLYYLNVVGVIPLAGPVAWAFVILPNFLVCMR